MAQTPINAPVGLAYANINTLATTTVKGSGGLLQGLVINSATAGATVTIYDNTAGSGTQIASFTLGAITTPTNLIVYGVNFKTGLTIVTAADAVNLTVIFR